MKKIIGRASAKQQGKSDVDDSYVWCRKVGRDGIRKGLKGLAHSSLSLYFDMVLLEPLSIDSIVALVCVTSTYLFTKQPGLFLHLPLVIIVANFYDVNIRSKRPIQTLFLILKLVC